MGPLLSYKFNYLYTKIPLSVFKIKIEVIKGEKIFVYNIHLVALLAYKSNRIFKKTREKSEKVKVRLKINIIMYAKATPWRGPTIIVFSCRVMPWHDPTTCSGLDSMA